MTPGDVVLRPAVMADADDIARIMRASLRSLPWMPMMHTPEEDRAFIGRHVLPRQQVTVAVAGEELAGFIAVDGERVEQLYLDPRRTGRGIGSSLLERATAAMPVVKLCCFQANERARRFYERHGFEAEAFGDGSANEEKLPDITYVRRRQA